ncbi:MAG: DUF1152 domain-containing protein [Solirubrobacterales bacterium]
MNNDLFSIVREARRALVLGIGGGGDVVGALAVARLCEALGTPTVLGGVSWERAVIDPRPGPRPMAEICHAQPLGEAAVLAGPATSTPEGIPFSEARMAEYLGTGTVLIDLSAGAVGAAAGIVAAAEALDCDLLVGVDVGGDVLAHGDEPGLASPLCDAVMVAAALHASERLKSVLAVVGPGCDGELSTAEVLERTAALGRAGAWLGTWGVTPEIADELAAAAERVPTEASLQVARCARGEFGETYIRGGRRRVELGPVGALILLFDPAVAARLGELPLASAVADTRGVEDGRAALADLGVHTELDYERARAREGS